MVTKLPAIQFYPGDWKKDLGVQALDMECRGIWFEMLLLMHDSEERGKLILNGQPMTSKQIANALGIGEGQFNEASSKILANGVADFKQNTWSCRKMIRAENLRQIRTNAGFLGGRNTQANLKQKATPSFAVAVQCPPGTPVPPPGFSGPFALKKITYTPPKNRPG